MDRLGTDAGIPMLKSEDFLESGLDLILDSRVRTEFLKIQAENPRLAKEILLASHYEQAGDVEHLTITETLRGHLNIVKAIEHALKRKAGVSQPFSVGDGASSLPLDESQRGSS